MSDQDKIIAAAVAEVRHMFERGTDVPAVVRHIALDILKARLAEGPTQRMIEAVLSDREWCGGPLCAKAPCNCVTRALNRALAEWVAELEAGNV